MVFRRMGENDRWFRVINALYSRFLSLFYNKRYCYNDKKKKKTGA